MRIPMRSFLVAGTFLLSVLLYVDRVCISAAKSDVTAELSLSDQQMGWVFAAFSLGYALFQTPSGLLADRLGPRRVLASIVAVWSLFTGLTAAAGSFASMLAVRFLFGAGEAGAFPGMARAMYSWIPMQERGLVQGINFSGSRIGAAVTLPLIAGLIAQIGWRPTFVILMGVGCVWSIVWLVFFRDDPKDAKWLSESEREYILANRQSDSKTDAIDGAAKASLTSTMWRSGSVWALCVQYFASNFIFFFGLTWFFPQLMTRYGLTGMQASLFAALPMVCGAIGNWTAGWWVDRLYARGKWRLSRRLPAAVGFTLAAIGIVGSAYATTPLSSSLWFSLCIFGADMTLSPSWSTCVDIGKSNAGVVSGTMNMAGNIGSFVTSLAFPYLLSWTGSPVPFFYVAAMLNITAIVLWFRIDPATPLLENAA
ncbi:MFS transporter, ACS family, glucarate transporter [Neorhodopirellula lusitana]|uniref:MFS transporter, ACS family, glucarate transporter n=1 Tax=Neorhodopirellula lusitana TaxID=445327 RepID=A0ABY1Q521_9BACT|nr:MFS transporter [Neorhodopirellula lusitana]SMP58710.1 MFS transporter, ACS family, glucarate transporter [Neorhodopirellula lusitana]